MGGRIDCLKDKEDDHEGGGVGVKRRETVDHRNGQILFDRPLN